MNNINLLTYKVKSLSKTKLKILNNILKKDNKYQTVYSSQSTIASESNCTREWVSKSTTCLNDLDLVSKKIRYKETCIYKVSPDFHNFEVRQLLKHLLPALAWIPLSVGMLINTQPIKSSHKNIKDIISTSSFEEKNNKMERNMSVIVNRVVEKLSLNPYQQQQLANYPDSMIIEAEIILSKTTEIEDKPAYLFGILRKKSAAPTTSSFKKQQVDYVSDNNNRIHNTTTQKPPFQKPFVPVVDSPEERKVKAQQRRDNNKRTQDRISTLYGQTYKEARQEQGLQSFTELWTRFTNKQEVTEPQEITLVNNDENNWWSQQQPMDIDDFDIL